MGNWPLYHGNIVFHSFIKEYILEFVLAALTFGLAAGLKPGPLGVFIIHETMSKGNRQGALASLAPFVTDGPIILAALFLTTELNNLNWFIALISIVGGVYLGNIAYKIFNCPDSINPAGKSSNTVGLLTAIKINFLNPSPYIFWLTIGVGYISMGTIGDASAFVLTALASLCITKFAVAWTMRVLGNRFSPIIYARILKSLSLPLLVFSIQLLYNGVTLVI